MGTVLPRGVPSTRADPALCPFAAAAAPRPPPLNSHLWDGDFMRSFMQNRARVTGFQNSDWTARKPRIPELPSTAWVCTVAASDDLRSLLSWPSLNKHVRIAQKTKSVNTVLGAGGEARCSGRLHPPSLGASASVPLVRSFRCLPCTGRAQATMFALRRDSCVSKSAL